jgi:DNA-binding protein H-NS
MAALAGGRGQPCNIRRSLKLIRCSLKLTQTNSIETISCEVMKKLNVMKNLNYDVMKNFKLEVMPIDQLWALHEEVSETLSARLSDEKRVLDERLNRLSNHAPGRRFYPPVLPKFRNPDKPTDTWSGRGRSPHWVAQQLRLGKRMEELKI